jgi:hypothetical protein
VVASTTDRDQLQFDSACLICRTCSEMCDLLSGDPRAECYASFGVDAERVDEYLGKTLCLEAAFRGVYLRALTFFWRPLSEFVSQ